MAFSSTLSRLNLIPKPSLPYALTTFKVLHFHKLLRTDWIGPGLSSNASTPRFSALKITSSAGFHTQISRPQDDDLIVLGIETSCDDTAAAIVSSSHIAFNSRAFERVFFYCLLMLILVFLLFFIDDFR